MWGNWGAMLALPLLVLHMAISPHKIADSKLMAALLLIGVVIDGTLTTTGFIIFHEKGVPIPLWLALLWLGLGTMPHHSLRWLKGRLLLSSILGAVCGPLAYWAGVRLEVATFSLPLGQSLLILALIWALVWPVSMYHAEKILSTKQGK